MSDIPYSNLANASKNYSKHLIEYFLLHLEHLYVMALLLSVAIYFFLYRGNEKMPQDYLIVFLVLGVIAIVITSFVAIHHWVKNSGRKRENGDLGKINKDGKYEGDVAETWLKRSRFILTTLYLFVLVVICGVKLNASTIPKSMTYGLGVTALILFVFTVIVFVYSFYSISARVYGKKIDQEAMRSIGGTSASQLDSGAG